MRAVVVAEKPSQAKDIQAAVGGQYGTVLPAQGHLAKLAEPEEVNQAWGNWGFDVLLPPGGSYPVVLDTDPKSGKAKRFYEIRDALKNADTLIIATDCDREGQLIGEEIRELARFKGRVLRAMFTAQDKKTLQKAFAELKPNEQYFNLYQAAWARQQADQIYNLTLTRAITVAFRARGARGAIGIGRVKTPTMAIVCRRELEILNFKKQDYFEIAVPVQVAAGQFVMRYAPDPKLLDIRLAEAIAGAARGWQGPLQVKVTDAAEGPPRLFDLPMLQKVCSAKFGWSAEKTLQVAQVLYDGTRPDGSKAPYRDLITYPRAETRYLAENQIEQVVPILQGLAAIPDYSRIPMGQPVIRKGKTGYFSDAGLAGVSHHAVIPNVNSADEFASLLGQLNADERKMFDLIARRFIAAMMGDHFYLQTNVLALVPVAGQARAADFRASGRVTKHPGWKAAYNTDGDDEPDDKEADDAQGLPAMKNGEPSRFGEPKLERKSTKPPPRYTEGSLIAAMQEAWRFIPEQYGEWRERLKEAKGIGTPATRGEVIKGLKPIPGKRPGQLEPKGKNIVPTQEGMALYKLLLDIAPRLVDPAVTAMWEMRLDAVAAGHLPADQVVAEIAAEAAKIVAVVKEKAGSVSIGLASGGKPGQPPLQGDAPSPAKLALAERLAAEKGIPLPADARTNWRATQAFLNENGAGGNGPPKPTALKWAEELAAEKGIQLPEECRTDWKVCSAFIDKHKKGGKSKKK